MNKLNRLIVVGLMALSSAVCLEWTPEAKKGFDEALRSVEEHRLPSPGVMEDPVNREWVENLRRGALEGIGGPGDVLFLNLGDPEVTRKYLEIYPDTGGSANRTLAYTIQPKIILAIAGDFYRDEPSADTRPTDAPAFPLSISACYVTQEIIKNTPVFSEVLKKWAREGRNLGDEGPARRRRDEMRVWWTENRTLFEAERYGEVKPPSTWTPDAASAEPKKPVSTSAQSAIPTSGAKTSSPETSPKATPSTVVKELPKSESTSTLPWIAGIVLVLVIIGVGMMMRRKA